MSESTKKKIVSNILSEKRNWVDATKAKPEPGVQVVMRLYNPMIIFGENETEIYPAEDIKVGTYVRDYDDPTKGSWHVSPPFPKFDYSPLSTKDRLNEDTTVTHWAEIPEDELEGWNTRFEPIFVYKKLNLEVDDEHAEDVYRALIWGAACIDKLEHGNPEAAKLVRILYDLQAIMDSGKEIDLTEEEYRAEIEKANEAMKKARDKQQMEEDGAEDDDDDEEDSGREGD